MGDERRADAALAADEGDGAAERLGRALDEELADGADDTDGVDRRDQIFADAAADEVAIELDVVDVADDDHLGADIANVGKAVELGIEAVARQLALDDDQIGRRRTLVELGGGGDAAHLDLDVGARHAAVAGRGLHDGGKIRRLAERLNRDAGNGTDIAGSDLRFRRSGRALAFPGRLLVQVVESDIAHWPTPWATVPPDSRL